MRTKKILSFVVLIPLVLLLPFGAVAQVSAPDERSGRNQAPSTTLFNVNLEAPATLVCNTNPITIPSSGTGTPYPSTINISGLGEVQDVNVHLLGMSHTWPDDIDILLVGPGGQNLIIMSDAGGSFDLVDVDLIFDDAASDSLPDSAQIVSGTYKPTNFGTGDTFPAPAPAPSEETTLSIFNGIDPNGDWSLYVVDDVGGDLGAINGGWCLDITTSTPTRLAVAHLAPFAMDPGTAVTVTLNGAPVLTDFAFADSTPYLTVDPGEYEVEVYPAGSATPAITGTFTLAEGTDYSVIAIGDGVNQPLELLALVDDNTAPAAGNFKLRLGHLAPFAAGAATLADVRLQDGTVVLDDVLFGDVASYLELPAGTYDLKITTPDGAVTLIDPMPVTLPAGAILSGFAVGDGSNQNLGVFAWLSDSEGFLLPLAPAIVLDPAELSSLQSRDSQVELNLSIANEGAGELTWEIYEFGGFEVVPYLPASADLPQGKSLSKDATFSLPAQDKAMKKVNANPLALINDGSFENGPPPASAWTEWTNTSCGWIGDWSAIWGVPAFDGIYDFWAGGYCGIPNTNYVQQSVSVPVGESTLSFWYLSYRPDPDDADLDYAYVSVDGTQVWTLDLIQANDTYPNFVNVTLDLSPWAGQVVMLEFGGVSVGSSTGNIRFDYIEWLQTPVCGSPIDIPWVSIDPISGALAGGEAQNVSVVFDSTGLTPGVYNGTLCVASNDPVVPLVEVPLSMTVADLAYLEVAHLAPFAADPGTAVTVTVDGAPVLTGFEYGDSTGYVTLLAGEHLVEIFPQGSPTPAITATVNLITDTFYSAIAVGDGANQDLGLLALEDDNTPPAAGTFHLRIGHLAPFAPGDALADVRLQDGTIILDDVAFGDVTGFLPLPAGEYDLKITSPDGATTYIDPLPVTFNDGDIISAYAVGDGVNQPLGVFAWPAGAPGFFLPLAEPVEPMARLAVAHLAPFAMDPGTAVTVTLNGTPVLTGFEFADSTAYLDIPAGITHTVEIFAAGSATPAISAEINLEEGKDYSAVAVGGANGFPLELLALEDDNAAPAAGNFKLRLGHLAPFAAGAGTLADVRLQDGTLILDDVPFGAVAGYLELPAGTYDLKITTPDGGTILIDPLPVTFGAGDIVTAFAVGDGANQALGVFAWPSDAVGFLLPLKSYGTVYLPLIPQGYFAP